MGGAPARLYSHTSRPERLRGRAAKLSRTEGRALVEPGYLCVRRRDSQDQRRQAGQEAPARAVGARRADDRPRGCGSSRMISSGGVPYIERTIRDCLDARLVRRQAPYRGADAAHLRSPLQAWLRDEIGPDVEVGALVRAPGGASKENFFFRAAHRALLLRLDPC